METLGRLLIALPLCVLLGMITMFVFSLVVSLTNLVTLGIAKLVRTALRIRGSSARVAYWADGLISITKTLTGTCLGISVAWFSFVSYGLGIGPNVYEWLSITAAALALFVWAPLLFVSGLLTSLDDRGHRTWES